MVFIEKLVHAQEEIADAQEKIDYLLRRLYGQTRERYTNPDQGELFEHQAPVIELPQEEEEEEVTRSRKKPRRLFGGSNKELPTQVIIMDPEGDLSHLEKIGSEIHRVFHYEPARVLNL